MSIDLRTLPPDLIEVKPKVSIQVKVGDKIFDVTEAECLLSTFTSIAYSEDGFIPHEEVAFNICLTMEEIGYLESTKTFNGIAFLPVYVDDMREVLIKKLKEVMRQAKQ